MNDEIPKHRKKKPKKVPKKASHKHDYMKTKEEQVVSCMTKVFYECSICGKGYHNLKFGNGKEF